MIVFCAADLIWATRIKSTADSLGIPCRPVRTPEMLAARLADSPVRALIVDLEAESAIELVRLIRTHGGAGGSPLPVNGAPAIHIIAFGPHVAAGLFAQAKAAGADVAMARGAFSARLPQILQELARDPGSVRDQLSE